MKTILGTFVIILLSLGAFSLISSYINPSFRAGYISNGEVYEEFVLKKELESKMKNTKNMRKALLDSMLLELQMTAREIEANRLKNDDPKVRQFETMRQQYLIKEEQFNSENARLEEQYTDQVWNQLNQYIQDYGKENGYAFIHGAVGNGSLMYGEEKHNITREVIEYVNKKYDGKK